MNEFDTAMQELFKALRILEGQTLLQAMHEVNKDPLARADINAVDLADATNSIKRLIRTAHQLDTTRNH
mgnify:CR=1 FL=1